MNIIVTGSISYDKIFDFPDQFVNYFHPEKLHQINVSFVVDRLEKQFGGTATNIAYNCQIASSYLKSHNKVKILSAVGKDGNFFFRFFKKNNIDASGILKDNKLYSAFGSVITDLKDNQIWGFYYGANKRAKDIKLDKYPGKDSFLVISANHPESFIHFQKEAIKYKIPYLYDPGMSLSWIKDSQLIKGIRHCQYLIGNDYEISMITKRLKTSVGKIVSKSTSVITTLGEYGVRYEGFNEKISLPAHKVKKVIDPTGAGDAFRGGFIAGIKSGLNLKDSLLLGNVMASFAIEKYGTANHKPLKTEISRRLKKSSG